jgi:hypothetical protein
MLLDDDPELAAAVADEARRIIAGTPLALDQEAR